MILEKQADVRSRAKKWIREISLGYFLLERKVFESMEVIQNMYRRQGNPWVTDNICHKGLKQTYSDPYIFNNT